MQVNGEQPLAAEAERWAHDWEYGVRYLML